MVLTPRLRLRRWREADRGAMAAINRDPEVTEFLNRPVDEAATLAFFAKTEQHWAEHGFGHCALEALEGSLAGELLGFAGVAYPTFLPPLAERPELGWRLALPGLISIIHPENQRSQRVAEKLGMSVEQRLYCEPLGRDVEVWALGELGHRPHPQGR